MFIPTKIRELYEEGKFQIALPRESNSTPASVILLSSIYFTEF
jgi:hypothetical protein